MNALLELISTEGPKLSQRVLERQYLDPFWNERFGERGRGHADEDSDFHLKYLRRAIAANDPAVMVRYAQWLREVLATRGMCTRHLAENFHLLAAEIEAQRWEQGGQAVAYLRVAETALEYPSGAARALQQGEASLASEIERRFRESHPEAPPRLARKTSDFRDDIANLLSYVADALAFGSPTTLAAHAGWLQEHLVRHGLGPGQLDALLETFEEVLAKRVETSEGAAFVGAARAGLVDAMGSVR